MIDEIFKDYRLKFLDFFWELSQNAHKAPEGETEVHKLPAGFRNG